MDPLGGVKPESTIIFLHDQYTNNKDIYEMFSTVLSVTAGSKAADGSKAVAKTVAPLNSRIVIP
jgi:hypothetical protein